jgi:aryl-alcohol dehydrogenase-like predicted oxidoreductase
MTKERLLSKNGQSVSAIGMGTWATGGPSSSGDQPLGWGSSWTRDGAADVLRAAFDAGITVFDTSDAYGTGTAERLIGETLNSVRDHVAIVTKWGNLIDEPNRQLVGVDPSPAYVRTALDASLARLRTDHVDLYLLHLSGLPAEEAIDLLGVLEELVVEGKIGAYGWSTDDPALAATWVGQPGFGAIEFEANVVNDAPDLVTICDDHELPGLVRGPLATGLLGGGHPAGSQITDADDFRFRSPDWLHYFDNGRPVERYARRLQAIREVLTGSGRTVAQGALCWLLARSPNLIPIPGAQTVEQARDNAKAIEHGPLAPKEVAEIRELLTAEDA